MTRKHLGLLLTFSLAVNAAFIGAWVAGRMDTEAEPEPSNEPVFWADLDLEPTEESKLRAHWEELGQEATDVTSELAEDRRRLFAVLEQDDPDVEEIVELQRDIGENQARLREMVVLKMLETSRELDPEARRKWAARMHDYAEDRLRRKPWHRPGHRLYDRRRGRRGEDVQELLRSPAVQLETVPLERGVELRFRSQDPDGVDALHEELPDWIRREFQSEQHDGGEHDRKSRGKHRRGRR
jgi:uncharacterized membrane protein